MYIRRITLALLLLPLVILARGEDFNSEITLSKKYEAEYKMLLKEHSPDEIYIIVKGIYYNKIHNVRYNPENAKLEVVIGYHNKRELYYFNPFDVEKMDTW